MAQAALMMRPRQDPAAAPMITPGKPPLSPATDTSLITSTVRKRKVNASDPADSPPLPQWATAAAVERLADDKRQRTPPVDRGLAHSDGVVHLQLASPTGRAAPACMPPRRPSEEREQRPGPGQEPHSAPAQQAAAQHHGGVPPHPGAVRPQAHEEAELFSPLFHLHKEGSHADLCAAGVKAAAEEAQPLTQQPSQPPPGLALPGRSDTDNTSTDHSTGTSASLSMAADGDACGDAASAECLEAPAAQAALEVEQAQHAQQQQQQQADDVDDECLDFDPLLFIKRLPPLERCVPPRREFLLPKKTRRSKQKTLVLDLDETLVHSTLDGYCRPDFMFPVEVGTMRHMVSVRQRPHLHTFLERVSQLYEVVVFTASQRVYAEQLLDIVDPERRLVRHRVFRESCVFWEGNYLKDLTVLGRDLAHTIIVDNSPQAFGFQLDNGIPIESWYDDDADDELLKLLPFLEKVAHAEDVRPHIQRRYRLRSLVEAAADPEQQYMQQAAALPMAAAPPQSPAPPQRAEQ